MKTNEEVLLALIEQLGGTPMVESFQREMLPMLRRSAPEKFDAPVTDEQYHDGMQAMRREMPALAQWLVSQDQPDQPKNP